MLRIVVNDQWCFVYGRVNTYDLDQVASYRVFGGWFAESRRSGAWDGRKRLYRKLPNKQIYKMPAGFVDDLCKRFETQGVPYELEDHRNFLCAEPVYELAGRSLTQEPRDYQAAMIDAACAQNGGVIHAFTGAGKTVVGAAILKSFDVPSLFLTHRKVLLHQTHTAFEELLQTDIGIIGDGICKMEKFTVGTIQTLTDKKFAEYLKNVRVVVADEVHHLESKQWHSVFDRVGAYHKYGLTATPSFKGPGIALIGYTGPTIYSISPQEGIERGVLVPPEICFLDYDQQPLTCDAKTAFKEGISRNQSRYDTTSFITRWLNARGARPLILVRYMSHAEAMLNQLARAGLRGQIIRGKTKTEDRKKYVDDLVRGDIDYLIGQVQIMGEGVDIPDLRAVINATGMKGGGSSQSANEASVGRLTAQIIGRAMRAAPGKEKCYYFDFEDDSHKALTAATSDRKEALKDYGYGQYFRTFGQLV